MIGPPAVEHLIALDHKRIGFIGISPEDAPSLHRYDGYRAALEAHNISLLPEYTVGPPGAPAYATQEDGFEGLMRLAKLPLPPTAVFARNDFAAIGAMRAAHSMGLAVPGDIAIAGFDNIPMAAFATPPITTVDQFTFDQGIAAGRFLLKRITGDLAHPRRVSMLQCTLLVRESTDPSAVQSKL